MFDGSVYYCWSCDGHCRAIQTPAAGPCCPRCREELSEDSRLEGHALRKPFFASQETTAKGEPVKKTAGLWTVRTAAMH